jgi:hypothetical protein
MNWYGYANGNPVMYVDPSGYVFGTPLTYGEFFSAAGSGAAQGAIAYGKGLAVGAAVTGAVIVAAPVVASVGASALVAAGVSAGTATAISTATVTTGIGLAGAAGAIYTGYDTYQETVNGNGANAAYNIGAFVGGVAVTGAGGGRYIADYVGPTRSTVPVTNNPFADAGYKFVRNPEIPLYKDLFNVMATAPTPSSGGAAATFIGSGVNSYFNSPPRK